MLLRRRPRHVTSSCKSVESVGCHEFRGTFHCGKNPSSPQLETIWRAKPVEVRSARQELQSFSDSREVIPHGAGFDRRRRSCAERNRERARIRGEAGAGELIVVLLEPG